MPSLNTVRSNLSYLESSFLGALADRDYMLTSHLTVVLLGTHNKNTERCIQRVGDNLKKLKAVTAKSVKIVRTNSAARAVRWRLTKLGIQLAIEDAKARTERLRHFKADSKETNLEHTLATVDIEINFLKLQSTNIGFKVDQILHEPKCHRDFDMLGGRSKLKPDLFATTTYNDETEQWFFETARKMHPCNVVDKCRIYVDYINKTFDSEWKDKLPHIVWVVVDGKHKDTRTEDLKKASFQKAVAKDSYLDGYVDLFEFSTTGEVDSTVLGGHRHE
ncbi:hypothetical protein FACS189431_2000 [Alphaproteobacteria bacterium]|nr:hypothetical protein FACS189431_2000 [Alphaproteobacteria bacterium]